MKILYDAAMPYADAFFADLGDAFPFEVGSLDASSLVNVDALFVRSTTPVTSALLSQATRLKFVATATAGFNHLDIDYLNRRGIAWYAAGGCNAIAVAEYVLSAIFELADADGFDPMSTKVAIVGAGNVGSALAKILRGLSIEHVLYDPPLALSDDERQFVSFEEVLGADIICLHTPLVIGGEYPTFHMFDEKHLSALSEQQYLINACRGEVVDNKAMLNLFKKGKKINAVLDVWENEPLIAHELIPHIRLATAHIAGHTLEGKARGTSMVYDAFCEHINKQTTHKLEQFLPEFENNLVLNSSISEFNQLIHMVKYMYDIKKDDGIFRSRMAKSEAFADIRKHYPVRREFSAATLDFTSDISKEINNNKVANIATSIGFKIAN